MCPRFHDRRNNPPPTEGALLSKIETALDEALNELGLESSQSSVKREKYIWLAVKEFTEDDGDPITYSWFKWGVSTLAGPGGATTSSTLVTEFPRATNLFQANPDDIKKYYISGDCEIPLAEWWEADFLDFLEKFYSHYGPPKYRDLYLLNIRLLKLFDDIEQAINFGRNPVRQETYEESKELMQDLKKEILDLEALEENYEYLNEFSKIFVDVVMTMIDLDGEDVEKGHQTAFSELEDFYRDSVWLMIAHSLSLETAVGPNTDRIYTWSSTKLESLRASFDDTLQTKKDICEAVDLLPELGDYADRQEDNEEFNELVDEFMSVVDGRATSE